MTNLVTGIIGIAGLCAFIGILLWWTKALPLIVIAVVVVGLVLWDFLLSLRGGNGNAGG
jgi:hypothetical protein